MEKDRDKNIIMFAVVGLFIVLIIMGVSFLITDSRKNMTSVKEMEFNESIIEIDNDYKKDDRYGCIDFTQLYMIGLDESFDIEVTDETRQALKYEIVKGKTTEEEAGGMIMQTEYRLKFELPEKFYYISIEIEKENSLQEITIDYRDFRNVQEITK